jgi:hypothetical protein
MFLNIKNEFIFSEYRSIKSLSEISVELTTQSLHTKILVLKTYVSLSLRFNVGRYQLQLPVLKVHLHSCKLLTEMKMS